VDSDLQSDNAWVLSVQTKLYQWSRQHPDEWCQGPHEQFLMGCIPIRRYRRGWMGKPDYAVTSGEPDA